MIPPSAIPANAVVAVATMKAAGATLPALHWAIAAPTRAMLAAFAPRNVAMAPAIRPKTPVRVHRIARMTQTFVIPATAVAAVATHLVVIATPFALPSVIVVATHAMPAEYAPRNAAMAPAIHPKTPVHVHRIARMILSRAPIANAGSTNSHLVELFPVTAPLAVVATRIAKRGAIAALITAKRAAIASVHAALKIARESPEDHLRVAYKLPLLIA